MRAVLQRVKHAKVEIEGAVEGEIQKGILMLLGIAQDDTEEDMDWLIRKIIKLRIFNDENGKMNRSVVDINGHILVVSQFTLYASILKGNRPSYIRSAPPDISIPIYERFVEKLISQFNGKVATGKFGAMMEVSLLNNGPVTLIIDSKQPNF